MADALIRPSFDHLKVPVQLAPGALSKLGEPWYGANGALYTPGDIGPEGCIVSAKSGELISQGVVWLARAKLAEAEAAGWRSLDTTTHDGELVQVRR